MTDLHIDMELAIQDRVLVETEVLGKTIAFRTLIVKVCPGELWLGLTSPDHRLEGLHEGQTLRLTVARKGSALLGQSGFLRPLGGSKSRVFAVVRPGDIERVQRRAHVRYDIELPVHFRQVDPDTRQPRGKGFSATTVNISPGGMLFETEADIETGMPMEIAIPLSSVDRLNIAGLVTRVRMPPETAPMAEGDLSRINRCEVAVKFTRVTAVDQDRIIRFVLANEHRRREAAARQPQTVPVPVQSPVPVPQAVPSPVQSPAPFVQPAFRPAAVAQPESPRTQPATTAPAPVPAPARATPPAPARPVTPPLAPQPQIPAEDLNRTLIAVGLELCAAEQPQAVRQWFDSLMPFARIELLSMLQANMAGDKVPGADEPGAVRPLARALGLLAA